ncbi:sigma-70 family RNA polymerase sigma factor [Planctomycetes bacterium SV_7m_r]|uniref:sigma-70 family RNA polymerase sigma factor n=1 Tax=Stieleria bergensis TaxID=2528025 RepID=UPI0011A01708
MPNESPSPHFHERFVRALTRHERVIRAYVRGAGISRPEDVDEIMQNVSLAAWRKFDQLENADEFPVWACVIARYEVLMFRRRHARDRLVLSENVYELLAEQSLEQVESGTKEKRLNQLQQCVEKLPLASRELVMAAYQPGSTIDQLATELGKSANTIYQQLWRIRRALEQCVEEALRGETI